MIRGPSAVACAFAMAGCTTTPATERSLALVRLVPVRAGEVSAYSDLCDVPGAMEVVSELEVANRGRQPSAIEHELIVLAGRLGADAIVLRPFNRGAFGAAYTKSGASGLDGFRSSRATAIRVFENQSRSQSGEAAICVSG